MAELTFEQKVAYSKEARDCIDDTAIGIVNETFEQIENVSVLGFGPFSRVVFLTLYKVMAAGAQAALVRRDGLTLADLKPTEEEFEKHLQNPESGEDGYRSEIDRANARMEEGVATMQKLAEESGDPIEYIRKVMTGEIDPDTLPASVTGAENDSRE